MGAGTETESLVEGIYQAGIGESEWKPVLQRITDYLGVIGMDMYLFRDDHLLLMASCGAPDEGFEEYMERYHNRTARSRAIPRIPAGRIYTDLQVITGEVMRREPYYEEWLRRWDFRHALMVPLIKKDNELAIMAAHRSCGQGPPEDADFERFGALVPHLQRSMKMQFKLLEAGLLQQSYLECLNKLDEGVLLIDVTGKVQHANGMAENIVRHYPELEICRGFLNIRHKKAQAWFNQALADVINGIDDQALDAAVCTLPANGALTRLTLYLSPLPNHLQTWNIKAVLFISDPSMAKRGTGREVLGKIFGLTTMESDLAEALLEGRTLRQHADARNVSLNTVRSQLRSVFNKTGTHRQAELVAMLVHSAGNRG